MSTKVKTLREILILIIATIGFIVFSSQGLNITEIATRWDMIFGIIFIIGFIGLTVYTLFTFWREWREDRRPRTNSKSKSTIVNSSGKEIQVTVTKKFK